MYGYHPVLPIELLKGDESANVGTLSKFLERTQEIWRQALCADGESSGGTEDILR